MWRWRGLFHGHGHEANHSGTHHIYTVTSFALHYARLWWNRDHEGKFMNRIQIVFLDCPAYLDDAGLARCGLPAEVSCRFIMTSTDGPLESATIRCPAGHFFNGPIEFLTYDKQASRRARAARMLSEIRPGAR